MHRSLLLAAPLLALSVASCQNPTTIVIACSNSTQCPTGNFCGTDNLCHLTAVCTSPKHACGSDCVEFNTVVNCGACGVECPVLGDVCDTTNVAQPCQPFCSGSLVNCGGTCRDTNSDNTNCGVCGTTCPSGDACVNGTCSVICPAGETNCSGACVNENTDLNSCGSCTNACAVGQYCVNGSCSTQCGDPLTICSGACVNPQIDAANCGSCGKKCQSGQICSNGGCQLQCENGLLACLVNGVNACIDTQSDQENCGTCGNVCLAGQACVSGSCTATCPTGQIACGGVCVTTATDPAHCGGCTFQCAAGQLCNGGNCDLSCQDGLISCDVALGDAGLAPTCVDSATDSHNCGVCGKICNPLEACVGGTCTLECPAGLTACGGTCVNLDNDESNCGGCGGADAGPGRVCGTGESCSSGVCLPSCPNGSKLCPVVAIGDAGVQTDAGVLLLDGGVFTCIDPLTDNQNCNVCGQGCAAGSVCSGGSCVVSCGVNSILCNGTCADMLTDPNNCGGCGTDMPDAGADSGTDQTHLCLAGETCKNGSCVSGCGTGLSVCNGLCYDLNNDPKNCGACNFGCAAGQTCALGVCQPGCQAVCDGICTNTNIDPFNCGACDNPCGPYANGTPFCSNKTCAALCASGFADCNSSLSDGCETNTTGDTQNCGACQNVCPSSDNSNSTCVSSKCGSVCQTGFGDCDGDNSNGCETNTANDAQNCGGCGTACSGSGNAFCGAGSTCVAASAGVPAGVQQNISITDLMTAGYSKCFVDAYNQSNGGDITSTVLASCSGTKLILGCRIAGSDTLLLAAEAPKSVVTTATTGNTSTLANGVQWYFTNSAWGFAPGGASIDLTSGLGLCDIGGPSDAKKAPGFSSQRLCWLTNGSQLGAGARCGDKQSLGGSAAYERVILSAP